MTKNLSNYTEVSKNNDNQHSRYMSISNKVIKSHHDEKHLLEKMSNYCTVAEEKADFEYEKKKRLYVKLDQEVIHMKHDEEELENLNKKLKEDGEIIKYEIKDINNRNIIMLHETKQIS